MTLWQKFKAALKKINVVDTSLLILMLILMAQSAFNLFVNEAVSQDSNAIDAVVRTSAAAIFGYFLSSNFVKKKDEAPNQTSSQGGIYLPRETVAEQTPKNQIGFAITSEPSPPEIGTVQTEEPQAPAPVVYSKHQVIIVSGIAIISLVTLLIFRNFTTMTIEAIATISQLRDFISASVGFLVGCGRYSTISD